MASQAASPAPSLTPLPPGWSENVAPTGHVYYYNAQTKESTYRRPTVQPLPPPPPPMATMNVASHSQSHPSQLPLMLAPTPAPPPAPYLRLSDPRVANAFMARNSPSAATQNRPSHSTGGGRSQPSNRPRRQPVDKPRSSVAIPGCEPWLLVYTKYGRRFVHNPIKNASYWRIPEKLLPAILELDKAGIRQKVQGQSEKAENRETSAPGDNGGNYSDSEYEEVEVWEDEHGELHGVDDGNSNPLKRRKIDEDVPRQEEEEEEEVDFGQGPVEFSEADIAFQLQAMAELGNDAAAYPDEEGYWDDASAEGQGGDELSEEKATELFKSLLDDRGVNPFGAWETLIEEGTLIDDDRYTALSTMKARKAAWEEWSRAKIKAAKEKQASEKKKDPRLAYLELLQAHATPKLYWPEFKRKYRKESAMKDAALSERDKEKWYRDYVARQKLPSATLKADLTKLLGSLSASVLNNQTDPSSLPSELLTDMRYVSLDPKVRDPLVEAYLQMAGPPPT